MSDWKRRVAVFLCMVMTLTTVFCMAPQQEVQAASSKIKFYWAIGTASSYDPGTGTYKEEKCQVGVGVGQKYLYIGDYLSAEQQGKNYCYYSDLSTQKGVTYASSNRNVIAVDKYGKLTVKKAGTATITVKFKGKSTKIKLTATDGELPSWNNIYYNNNTSDAEKLVKYYGTGLTAKNRYQVVNQMAKLRNCFLGISTMTQDGINYIVNPVCTHANVIRNAVNVYCYNTANPLSTSSSQMFKINSVSGRGTKVTITLKSKVTADQIFGLAFATRETEYLTIKKKNTCQFKIRLRQNGKLTAATATAKVGSNKITIKTKKLTKGKNYTLIDCYNGDWLYPPKGGNRINSFIAK